jgi:hypothetical protein
MNTERDGHLPFLDIHIYGRPHGSLGHKVYCKPTHTNLYLNSTSHHHPSNKLPYFPHRYMGLELCVIKTAFMQSLCSWETFSGRTATWTGRFAWPSALPKGCPANRKPDSVAFLPYVRSIFNHTSRVLSQHNIKSVGLPPSLRSVEDHLGLNTPEYTASAVSAVRSTMGRWTV